MLNNLKFEWGCVSQRGTSHKDKNEDSFLALPECGVFAVADGMGGYRGGDLASQAAVETLKEYFSDLKGESTVPSAILKRSFEACNFVIHQHAIENPEFFGMGTTIVSLFFQKTLAIAHVGDSRCYLLRKKTLTALTEDHSVLENPDDEHSRNILARAVGCDESLEVDNLEIEFEKDDVFLLCSDGLTNFVSEKEIEKVLVSPRPLQLQAENLARLALSQGSKDDITVLIVCVN